MMRDIWNTTYYRGLPRKQFSDLAQKLGESEKLAKQALHTWLLPRFPQNVHPDLCWSGAASGDRGWYLITDR